MSRRSRSHGGGPLGAEDVSLHEQSPRAGLKKDVPAAGAADENSAAMGNFAQRQDASEAGALAALREQLLEARREAKLAAELGQELWKADQAKAAELSALREEMAALDSRALEAGASEAAAAEALEEARAECAALKERARATEASADKVKRAGLEAAALQSELEARLADAEAERDQASRRMVELQATVAELRLTTPRTGKLRRSNSAFDVGSPLRDEDGAGGESFASRRSRRGSPASAGGGGGSSEDEDDELLLSPSGGTTSKLHKQLGSVRKENEKSRKKIRQLESVLAQTKLEKTFSARKVAELSRNMDEYKEMLISQSELANTYKDQLEGGGAFGEPGAESMDALIVREELARLRDQVQSQELMALIREDDLEKTVAMLMELEERFYAENGKSVTLRRRRKKRAMYSTCDVGVGTEPMEFEAPPDPIEANAGLMTPPPAPMPCLAQKDGYSGPVLVKFRRKGLLAGLRAPKWKARICELRGPHLLFFTNEWDTKPCRVVPIDGTEVRVVRRPHHQAIADLADGSAGGQQSSRRRRSGGRRADGSRGSRGSRGSGGRRSSGRHSLGSNAPDEFAIDLEAVAARKSSRQLGRQMSFATLFGATTAAAGSAAAATATAAGGGPNQKTAKADRATRVMHEFHLWHPRRPAVYFSAPTHEQMAQWAEHIQRQSTSVAVKPLRHAAGYITVVDGSLSSAGTASRNLLADAKRSSSKGGSTNSGPKSKDHLRRYFAVLRQDGLYLYSHPKKQTAKRVILLDSRANVWKPETGTQRKASLLLADVRRCFCVSSTEQGRSTFLADTEVDTDWWVSTIKAHNMGVVSWGSLTGIRDDEPFGCLNI